MTTSRVALAYVLVSGFILGMAALFKWPIPQSNEQLLTYMLGQLSGFVGAIVTFEFGSSRGSEEKTRVITDQMQSLGTPIPHDVAAAADQVAGAAVDEADRIERRAGA